MYDIKKYIKIEYRTSSEYSDSLNRIKRQLSKNKDYEENSIVIVENAYEKYIEIYVFECAEGPVQLVI